MKIIKVLFCLLAVTLFVTNCTKEKSTDVKNSKLVIDVTSDQKTSALEADTSIAVFEMTDFTISIVDLKIEENTDNDNEQDGEFENEDIDNESDSAFEEGSDNETENDEIILAGPFTVDVINGEANLGEVDVYPGTFKKVDFTFLPSDEVEFGGNSIILKGNYIATDGIMIPVMLKSPFNEEVQVELANGGVTVESNSTVTLSIVLDAQSWIESIDLSTATISNNEILIDGNNNVELLTQFNEKLVSLVEVEK